MAELIEGDATGETPRMPSARRIELAVSAWQQMRADLMSDEELLDDENAISVALNSANAEDPRDLLAKLIDATVWTERRYEEAKRLKAEYDERRSRYEHRLANMRILVEQLMTAIPVSKYRAKLASASIGEAPASLVVTDEQLIPEEWFKVEKSLRRGDLGDHMRETGEIISGAYLSNGGTKLTIRKVR
jgi:hypothetical protein